MRNPYLILLAVLISFASIAQVDVDDKSSWQERIYKGGGGGFSAGSNNNGKFLSISLSPFVGYMITSNFSAGIGVTYQYTSYSDINLKYSIYGVNPYLRYNIQQLFLMGEYNYLSIPTNVFGGINERVFRDRLLFGIGYAVPAGSGKGKLNVMALYDVLYKQGQGFSSPVVIRVFVSF